MPQLSPDLQQQLSTRVEQCYQLVERKLGRKFPRPQVLTNQRGRIAGCALLQKNTLRFHPLIYQQNQAHFLEHVVAHEIAHLVVWQCYGKTPPHGKHWQWVMNDIFNLPALRTHQYNTDNIGIRTVRYRCLCAEIPLSMNRHNKVIKGAVYCCKRCKSPLKEITEM
ncbi:SprT family zinc-dependent metalloprotease [Psychrobium sp. 1_MG-2023]|uniref:SprT family zinc-dependent metalloprotease n=1 Tax=Psychrobium sp. 1_MG-2023 TaxID=3062624 RepID=UPI000C32AA9A|nr:SprT family zinc-dependent metalloprotease [Psychrobium sp. 1_MG-2023]MDP2561202.1 SprT family zinc-dependent metalloprotease [Psychrobium sp. 1_MG-2023]PKF55292.1 SprT family zinc-dependent metalloprotease [Alteromonadales bacterium alter-6D02]